ncbi:MAG: carboxypeptidase regulatory-like domain-containing protein [bacterium]
MKYIITIALILMVLMQCGGQKAKVVGLVEVGSVYGFVTDETQLPIAKAQVLVAGDREFIAFTNDAGYFIFDDIIPGKYNIVVTRSGYAPENLDIKVSKYELNELNIVLIKSEKQGGMISGMVVDYISKEPLVVEVMVTDLGLTTATDSSGKFTFENLDPVTYLLKVQAMDYITSHTDVTVQPDENAEIVVHLIRGGTVITLEGIEFEFGKAVIKKASSPTLDMAAAILTNHPEIEVEIQGHTDSIGTAEANLKLSQARAEAVRDYLIDIHMIEPVRLIPIGYGQRMPVADNATEAGRAKNRRVDFVVLKD